MQHPQIPFDHDVDVAHHLIGTIVADKWEVVRFLGAGGTAAVYSAVHVNNGRKVALKVLHESVAHSEVVRERFFGEAFAANQIDHPGTVPAFDDGVLDDGRPFLVLELLEGESLDTMWERRGMELPVAEVLHIGQAVLSVVGAAHEKGILHRDIKPENLFIATSGEIKLLDFGIAKVTDSQRSYKTTVGDAMGTPAFMPPEQARGRWGEVDERSDIWAVSATLFTLITGRFIHDGSTTNEILLSAMCHPAPPIRTLSPDVPEAVARLIDRGLSFDKSKRFATAREMYDALSECIAQLPASVSEAPPRSQRRRKVDHAAIGALDTIEVARSKTKTRTAVVLLAVVGTALGVAGWSSGVSVDDVRAVLLQKPDGLFAHLPGDPTLQADKLENKTTGTIERMTAAKLPVFSEGGPAPADPEVIALPESAPRYEPMARTYAQDRSPSDGTQAEASEPTRQNFLQSSSAFVGTSAASLESTLAQRH